jgi:hypothetical protein
MPKSFFSTDEEISLRNRLWRDIGAKKGVDEQAFSKCLHSIFLNFSYLDVMNFEKLKGKCEQEGLSGEIVERIFVNIFNQAFDLAENSLRLAFKLFITSISFIMYLLIEPYATVLPALPFSEWLKVFFGIGSLLGIFHIIKSKLELNTLKKEMNKSYFREILSKV